MTAGRVLSPVDYDAWNRGYMPPSEHVLIDALTYCGAKVLYCGPAPNDARWWIVTEGEIDGDLLSLQIRGSLAIRLPHEQAVQALDGLAEEMRQFRARIPEPVADGSKATTPQTDEDATRAQASEGIENG